MVISEIRSKEFEQQHRIISHVLSKFHEISRFLRCYTKPWIHCTKSICCCLKTEDQGHPWEFSFPLEFQNLSSSTQRREIELICWRLSSNWSINDISCISKCLGSIRFCLLHGLKNGVLAAPFLVSRKLFLLCNVKATIVEVYCKYLLQLKLQKQKVLEEAQCVSLSHLDEIEVYYQEVSVLVSVRLHINSIIAFSCHDPSQAWKAPPIGVAEPPMGVAEPPRSFSGWFKQREHLVVSWENWGPESKRLKMHYNAWGIQSYQRMMHRCPMSFNMHSI